MDVCSSPNSWLVKRTLLRCKQNTLVTAAFARIFSRSVPFFGSRRSHRALSTRRVRVIVICAMFTTVLTPRRHSPPQQPLTPPPNPQNKQARHVTGHIPLEASSARWDDEYGRLAMNSPRARCEHNTAGALTPPATQLTNTSSRQHRAWQIQSHPCFSRHERKATLERVSITRNEKDTTLTLLVGPATPGAGCRGKSEKQVGTWFALGKDQSPMKEGAVRKQHEIEFLIAAMTEIHMYTDLHVAHIRARRGGRIRCVSGQSMTV